MWLMHLQCKFAVGLFVLGFWNFELNFWGVGGMFEGDFADTWVNFLFIHVDGGTIELPSMLWQVAGTLIGVKWNYAT